MTDDELCLNRLRELAKRALYRNDAVFTHFLDLRQAKIAVRAAAEEDVSVAFNGGYAEAERQMAAFRSTNTPEEENWPISTVRLQWNPLYGIPGHRDILGAVMALGFDRDRIGDIAIERDKAYVIAETDMADYIGQNLTKAGHVTLKCTVLHETVNIPPPRGRFIRVTLASLRLDALVAAGFSLSRSEAAAAIVSGRVLVDQTETIRPDAQLSTGALVSMRGMGRFRLEKQEGETRKGRMAARLFIFESRNS